MYVVCIFYNSYILYIYNIHSIHIIHIIILRIYMPSTRYSMGVTYYYICVLIPLYAPASVDSQALEPAMLCAPHTFYVC